MANLVFKYGPMNCGKSINILQTANGYEEKKLKFVIIKPEKDTKGADHILSRIGIDRKVDILLSENESLLKEEYYKIYYNARIILVDEVEFLEESHIEELWAIAHLINIPVITYGLKSNFAGKIFSGAIASLFSLADEIEEIGSISICSCGKKAIFNARKENDKFTDKGEIIIIDGSANSVEYVPLCGDCYLKNVKLKSLVIIKLSKLVETVN